MALINLMGKGCPVWAVGQERASHTNCPGPAALPFPKPRLDLQPHGHGQVNMEWGTLQKHMHPGKAAPAP